MPCDVDSLGENYESFKEFLKTLPYEFELEKKRRNEYNMEETSICRVFKLHRLSKRQYNPIVADFILMGKI